MRKNNVRKNIAAFVRNRTSDVLEMAVATGLVGILDYVGGDGINHALGDIAIGAGMTGGFGYGCGNIGRVVTSLGALVATMYPDIARVSATGDFQTFVKEAGLQLVVYGVGALIGTGLGVKERRKYDSMIDVNVAFDCQRDAEQAYEFIDAVARKSDYILTSDSVVNEPRRYDDIKDLKLSTCHNVHAHLVGKGYELRMRFVPTLKAYFEETLKPSTLQISNVVKVLTEKEAD